MKFYVFSDTHFNHKNIIDFCDRPSNHEEIMFKNMSMIKETDCLFHLGDIVFGKHQEAHEKYIKPLICKKILVLGNHDNHSYSWYMDNGWDFACDLFKMKYAGKIICFSHRPQIWDGDWEINIHGHLHNLDHRKDEWGKLKDWHILYSPELRDYKPIELSKLVQGG